MRQSYDKEQHAIAKENQQALIVIGWNGKYLPASERRDAIMFDGPATPEMLAVIKNAFRKLCDLEAKEAEKGAVTP